MTSHRILDRELMQNPLSPENPLNSDEEHLVPCQLDEVEIAASKEISYAEPAR